MFHTSPISNAPRESNALSGQHGKSGFTMKLVYTALISAGLILTACGGGGGGSDDKESKITLASIDAYFPPLTGLTVTAIESNKEYPTSASKASNFAAYLQNDKSFVFSGSDSGEGWSKYTKTDASVTAEAYIFSFGFDLYLNSDETITHNDALFNSVYGAIDANIAYVHIAKTYAGNPSSEFEDYANLLKTSGKASSCNKSGGDWECVKQIDGLLYFWETDSNEAIWTIRKPY
ncbi:hypothetical protein FACS189487_01950 [Campylobacterota bacterium]|nr:hypothetical protein FACS189487_01950 [Campylobacterota bacterium]